MTTDPQYRRFTKRQILHVVTLAGFFICAAVLAGSWWHIAPLGGAGSWAEVLLPILALATTLVALARGLPAQNVILVAALIALISGIVETVGAKTGVPFGSFIYTENLGPQLFSLLPWPVPLIWVVVILNSRGVARLILRPWRKLGRYGLWVMGLTVLLAVVFDLGLEPFAARVNRYWIWRVSPRAPAWHTAPWVNFLGWAVTVLLILAFVTPWLINKRASKQQSPDYHPLVVWLTLNLFLTTGNATHQLWSAAGFGLLSGIIVTFFAMRGAHW